MPMHFFEYMDVATFVVILCSILAVIVLINNAVKALREMAKPVTDLRDEINKINERLDEVDKKLIRDYGVMEHQHELDRLLLRSVRQLVIHEIDNNDIESMHALQTEIDDYLITHA